MSIKNYDDIDMMELDVIREIGSIGTSSAANVLSSMLHRAVRITLPEVSVLGYNEAISKLGNPEDIVATVLVEMSGDIHGIMFFMLRLELMNELIGPLLGKRLDSYEELGEMERSAVVEVGNIMISSYINALSQMTSMGISLSVPKLGIDMLGGIMTVPIAELGYTTDKLMIIQGRFVMDGKEYNSNVMMLPDIPSLNHIMEKLVHGNE